MRCTPRWRPSPLPRARSPRLSARRRSSRATAVRSDRREESEREATLRFQLTEEVLALQQQQEAALQRVLDAREAAFERELPVAQARGRGGVRGASAARRRAETRLAELEEALKAERDARTRARRQSDAALAAEAEALSLAYDLARGSEGSCRGEAPRRCGRRRRRVRRRAASPSCSASAVRRPVKDISSHDDTWLEPRRA